jgi:hypothetical protein
MLVLWYALKLHLDNPACSNFMDVEVLLELFCAFTNGFLWDVCLGI